MRLTKKLDGGSYSVPVSAAQMQGATITGEAIEKLGKLEDIYEDLTRRQVEIGKRLEELRGAGREKSVQFRELLAEKLANNHVLSVFDLYL